jgi:hypothetical protein
MKRLAIAVVAALAIGGCDESPASTSSDSRLRIRLTGSVGLENLTVLFPGARVSFGSLPGGTTSAYRDVPAGVYRYAAYEFTIDGEAHRQPVIDWVGESPMEGRLFTYTIEVRPAGPFRLELVSVTRDQ